MHLTPFLSDLLVPAAIVAGSMVLYHILFYFIKRRSRLRKRMLPGLLSQHIYYPCLLLVSLVSAAVAADLLEPYVMPRYFAVLRHALLIALAIAVAFLLARALHVAREVALHHYAAEENTLYGLRKAKTKLQLIQRLANFVIIFATLSVVLMTFRSVREVGATLLASAGVLGIVIGFAAQKSLGTLFAGLQIALSQPIRIDDTVVVEGQFGTIGEITLTYVIVNLWDGRRLVVPINYFLEKPFENWTRVSPEVVSKVKVYADYSMPVQPLREQVKQWLADSPLWDQRSWGLVVTAATESTIEIRATMSARNSGDAFDLECLIREKLVAYMQEHYPERLPVQRWKELRPGERGGAHAAARGSQPGADHS